MTTQHCSHALSLTTKWEAVVTVLSVNVEENPFHCNGSEIVYISIGSIKPKSSASNWLNGLWLYMKAEDESYFRPTWILTQLPTPASHVSGSPMSFSNPILWHRGQNLTAHSEPRKSSRGVYQTFFNWFSDHSNPGQDDVAQVQAAPAPFYSGERFRTIVHRGEQL